MPVALLPDVVAVVRQALLGQAAVVALVSTRIYNRIPATPTFPLVVVTKVSEQELQWHTSNARVQIDCWAAAAGDAGEAQADLIGRTILASMRDLVGTWSSGKVSNTGLALILTGPDPDTGRARRIIDLFVETNP